MSTVHRLPARRDIYLDERGEDRGMRLTTYPEEGIVAISIWHDDRCTASFRLPMTDCARLIGVLATGLNDQLVEKHASLPLPGRRATSEG